MSVNDGRYTPGQHPSVKTEFGKGHVPWNKGKPHLRGEAHPRWNGGYTSVVRIIRGCSKYNTWRLNVFRRDKRVCQTCGSFVDVEAHHITKFMDVIRRYDVRTLTQALHCPELWDVSNGVTICKKCHREVESLKKI